MIKIAIIDQLKSYTQAKFRKDALAGLTVAVMLVPQGMAYALLAGLPPIYGLYAGLVPLLIYPIFGSSRHLSVGPVALVSLLVLSGLSQLAEPGSQQFIQLAMLTAFVAGVIQVLLSILRLGFLVNFLSHPVISGFTAAAAFIIGFSQLKYVTGISAGRSNNIASITSDMISNIEEFHLLTFGVGLGSILLILLLKRIKKLLPAALLVVFIGSLLTYLFSFQEVGLQIVKDVPEGLPVLSGFGITWDSVVAVLPLALVICLVSFIESLAIAKTLSAKQNHYPIDANQELMALGLAKIGGSFFQAFPNTGSFTRSAINEQSGATTGLASIIAATLIGITLLFLTSLFYYLPKAVLAAIILVAIVKLVDIKEIRYLYQNDKRDFVVFIGTFIFTLIMGIQQGVFAGIVISVLFILYKTSRPHFAILGRIPGSNIYKNIERFDDVQIDDDLLIFRLDASLYFGNAEYFYDRLEEEISKKGEKLKAVILDTSSILDVDTTGMQKLKLIISELKSNNVTFYITEAIGPVRDLLNKNRIEEVLGKECQFMTTQEAIDHIWSKRKININ